MCWKCNKLVIFFNNHIIVFLLLWNHLKLWKSIFVDCFLGDFFIGADVPSCMWWIVSVEKIILSKFAFVKDESYYTIIIKRPWIIMISQYTQDNFSSLRCLVSWWLFISRYRTYELRWRNDYENNKAFKLKHREHQYSHVN